MPVRPVLALDTYSTSVNGMQKAYAMIGATTNDEVQIGNTFSIASNPVSNYHQTHLINTTVRWGDIIYALYNGSTSINIYMYDINNPSNGWSIYKTLTAVTNTSNNYIHTGIYIVMLDREPYLIGVCTNSSGNLVGFKINLITDVKTETTGGSLSATTGYKTPIIHRNILYWIGPATAAQVSYYDPQANTLGTTTGGYTNKYDRSVLVSFNDTLYHINSSTDITTNPTYLTLYELDETTKAWTTAYTTSVPVRDFSGTYIYSRWAAWPGKGKTNVNGDSLWVLSNTRGLANTNPTWQLHEIYWVTDINVVDQSSMLPSNLRNNATGATSTGNGKWYPFIDHESSPGDPIINLFLSSTSASGGILSRYLFDPSASSLTLIDVGHSNSGWIQIPLDNTYGAGDRFWSPGQPTIRITTHEAINDTDQRITFIISSSNQTDPVNVEFYFNNNTQYASTRCSLSNPSSGTIMANTGGDYVANLTADGVTEYQVTWLASDDGVSELDFIELVGRVYT